MNSSSTYSSIASHYPLKLLLALTCGVHLMNTIYEEYFVFSWMPQQYPKKILGNYIYHPYVLEANKTISPCLIV